MIGKKRGPKPMPAEAVKRNSFTFRLLDDLKAKIVVAAEASGKTMSEEVEIRLRASFDQPALIDALAVRMFDQMRKRAKPVRFELTDGSSVDIQVVSLEG